MALPSLRSSRPPPSWVPLLHAHYGRFLARTDPLPPVRAALRLFPEHEHRPSPHRTGLPPSRPHPLWPFRRQSPDGPAPSLLRATLQRGARTESPLSDFAFYPAGSSDASGRIAFVILRTGPPPPIAPHAASRRRSYRQFQAGERMPGEDLHLSGCVRLEAHRVGPRSRPTWRCWIGSETRTLRAGMALVFPIRQRASLRDARRTALRVPPFLRVSVVGRYLRMLRCLIPGYAESRIHPSVVRGKESSVRLPTIRSSGRRCPLT